VTYPNPPAAPIGVTPARRALQYTGSNSAALAAAIDDFTVVSEDASGLVFTSGGQQLTVAPHGWLAFYRGVVAPEDVFANDDDFRDEYMDVDQGGSHIHTLTLTTGPAKPAPATEGDE
jgi:hypothetical protein